MIRFGELGNVAGKIRSPVSREETREELGLRSLKERVFQVWITWEDIDWSLKSNHDGNLPHRDPEVAMVFIKRVLPEAISALPLKKPFRIVPGLLLLTHCERIGIDIGLEYFGDPLLPVQLHVIWQVPLIVIEDEPQLVEFGFKPLGKNQCLFEARYGDERFRRFFKDPIMVSYSKREQVSPFVFCTESNRKSGIDENTRNEFRRVIEGKCYERWVSQGKSEINAYWKSVGLPIEITKEIYEENVPPTAIGAKIPSDTPLAIDGKKIYRGKIFLWSVQKLYFNQARKWELDKELLMKVLPWRESKRTVKILGREMKMKIQFVDEVFLDEESSTADKICCLGKSVIMSPL